MCLCRTDCYVGGLPEPPAEVLLAFLVEAGVRRLSYTGLIGDGPGTTGSGRNALQLPLTRWTESGCHRLLLQYGSGLPTMHLVVQASPIPTHAG